MQCACCVGIFVQYLLADLQGLLEEWLGLLVLPLILIEPGQVMQCVRCVAMIDFQYLLANLQGFLEEWLSLYVSSTSAQVTSSFIKQSACFYENELVLVDQRGACLDMGEQLFTACPG